MCLAGCVLFLECPKPPLAILGGSTKFVVVLQDLQLTHTTLAEPPVTGFWALTHVTNRPKQCGPRGRRHGRHGARGGSRAAGLTEAEAEASASADSCQVGCRRFSCELVTSSRAIIRTKPPKLFWTEQIAQDGHQF